MCSDGKVSFSQIAGFKSMLQKRIQKSLKLDLKLVANRKMPKDQTSRPKKESIMEIQNLARYCKERSVIPTSLQILRQY